jgi:hypothetical protein
LFHLLHLFFGNSQKAKVSGSTPKYVRCAECGCEYVYIMNRTGHGSESNLLHLSVAAAARKAEAQAAENLKRRLMHGLDPVPCPDCGIYQPDMVRALKHRKWWWTRTSGLFLLVAHLGITILAAVSQVVYETHPEPTESFRVAFRPPAIYFFASGFVLFSLGWFGRISYYPNAKADQRAGKVPVTSHGPFRREEFEHIAADTSA